MTSRNLLALALCVTAASAAAQAPPAASQAATPKATAPQAPPAVPTPGPDGFDEAAAVAALKTQIAGKEQLPAKDVFKDVRILSNVPAGRLLGIMQGGYSRSLGVTCTHCHVPGAWEKEDKPEKQIARDMVGMSRAITEQYLRKIENIKTKEASANCNMCHRGQARPALALGQGAPRPQGPGAGTPPPAATAAPPAKS